MEIGGKEYTEAQLAKLVSDAATSATLIKEQKKKLDTVEDQTEKLARLAELEKENKAKSEENLKLVLGNRLAVVSKWFNSKEESTGLADQIAQMSNDAFELFKEGKTDDVYQTKEEIDKKQTELDSKTSEFETNKEKIINDAVKKVKANADNQPIVPPTEVTADGTVVDGTDDEVVFPSHDALKENFRLKGNPMYKIVPSQEQAAKDYLDVAYQDR